MLLMSAGVLTRVEVILLDACNFTSLCSMVAS